MSQVFESENGYFAARGNGQFGNVIRQGWKPSRLGQQKKNVILSELAKTDTDQIYRRGTKIFKTVLNGTEEQIC